uniref:Uncharacterized protein n=1 Tax=Romanomermis culicivorax TaxID=13658 RepID=A0A915HFP1_ROMCU
MLFVDATNFTVRRMLWEFGEEERRFFVRTMLVSPSLLLDITANDINQDRIENCLKPRRKDENENFA